MIENQKQSTQPFLTEFNDKYCGESQRIFSVKHRLASLIDKLKGSNPENYDNKDLSPNRNGLIEELTCEQEVHFKVYDEIDNIISKLENTI